MKTVRSKKSISIDDKLKYQVKRLNDENAFVLTEQGNHIYVPKKVYKKIKGNKK